MVGGDGVDPCFEAGFATEGVEVFEGDDEDVVGDVFHVVAVGDEAVEVGFELGLEFGEEGVEGADVSGLGLLDEGLGGGLVVGHVGSAVVGVTAGWDRVW